MDEARLQIDPAPTADVLALERALGVAHPVAQVLVRRGLGDPEHARTWLAADVAHDPASFEGLAPAVAAIGDHLRRGDRIVVHGDYDVDGVCSTAVLVRALNELGGDVGWHLPSRTEDGYGLSVATAERLAAQGTGLMVTVDCGITAIEAVAAARRGGMDVVVTDHHAPRADGELPDAHLVHPLVGDYPCPYLCAAGVAYVLSRALYAAEGRDPALADADLDIVALATIADCVPLRDENRRLVREGLRALAATSRPGLRALMAVSGCDPSAVDERSCGFRLAPRINAAGRLGRADAGLELLLTDDLDRAEAIAHELDDANAERRHVETRILFDAEAQVAAIGEPKPAAYVLAGRGWHPGVVGIVAARIAERHHRPAVLIALPEDEGREGSGSGRSIPTFDLLAGFEAGAAHLLRHGGHKAAAGLTIDVGRVDDFRAAFVEHAERTLTDDDFLVHERVDAVVAGDELNIELAEQLARLGPFGQGNPDVSLLVPSASLADARQMGEGKHIRFAVESGGVRARAVAFGTSRLPEGADEGAFDATFAFELNEYAGTVEPRLRLRRLVPVDPRSIELVGEPADPIDAAIAEATSEAQPNGAARGGDDRPGDPAPIQLPTRPSAQGRARDRRGGGIVGIVASLVASGESVVVVCADARARRRALQERLGGFAVCSWASLERVPETITPYQHVVIVDPPAEARQEGVLELLGSGQLAHLIWGPAELACSENVHRRDLDLRAPLRDIYVALRAAGEDGLAAIVDVGGPVRAGRAVRVLVELGLVDIEGRRARLLDSVGRTQLELSPAFCEYQRRLEEGLAWMSARHRTEPTRPAEAIPA